ncbi:MAG TPA: glycerol-3-phosphate 1-O-acyltransferase PlsY [Candidatus Binataceae bacterium]|nr:glycerol-3-phosphate 1-O-acyltransferase PlsY [Candidatus Binataceae bacterium]
MRIALLVIGAYLFGSIPVGVLVGRAFGFDPREVGSGNIGMTNVTRAGGSGPGAITFAGDLLKGLVPVLCARIAGLPTGIVALVALGAFAGAISSIFLRFSGGKGVSASLGIWLAISPMTALVAVVVFGIVFAVARIVSLASISAAIVLPPAAAVMGLPRPFVGLAIVMTALVLLRHHENIARLIKGEERPAERKKTGRQPAGAGQ